MSNTQKIRELNDAFRQTFTGGTTVITQGVALRPDLPDIIERVRRFDAFEMGNDPYAEHDFGSFQVGDQVFFWKIDAYDLDLNFGSPDPSDPAVTKRIMTVMLGGLHPVLKTPSLVFLLNREVCHGATEVYARV